MKVRSTLFLGLAAAALAAPAASHAGVVSRADAGAAPADLALTDQAIQADLGGAGTFGRIAWDGVPAAVSAPTAMPANQFLAARGVLITSPSGSTEVSSPDDSGLGQRFADLNGAYLTEFRTFSGDQIFRAKDSTVTNVDFFLPGSQTPATTKGFAVAFTDVDLPNTTKVEAFDVNGNLIGATFAPPADKGVSIASVVADAGAPIAKVRITSGSLALSATAVDNLPAGQDIVAMDDFIIGNTVARPDLAVTVADAPDPVETGANLTYTVTVTNAGAGASTTSTLHWSLPAGVAQVSATPSQGTCATATSCDLGAIAAAGTATVTIVAKPTAAGSVQAQFWTTAANDGNAANDNVTASTTVNAPVPGDTRAPKVAISGKAVTIAANGNATFAIGCPKDEKTCKGSVRITSAKALRIGGLKLRLDLGSARFTVAGGKTAQVKVKIGAAERTLLKALGQIQVKVDVAVSDAAGNDATASKNVVLKARK